MKKNFGSPYDISEDDVKIDGKAWDDEACQVLWVKHSTQCDSMEEFWGPAKARAKKCFDYEKGSIFTPKQLKTYSTEDKYPVQPRLVESRIYALMGEILKGRRSGSITVEGGSLDNPSESATKVSIANVLMKDMEKDFKERRLIKDALHDGLVGCFPVWAWIEKGLPSKGEGVLNATLLPWDSTAVAPFHFRYPEEITCVKFRSFLKEAELVDKYPKMKKQIVDHRQNAGTKDNSLLTSISEWETTLSSRDRSRIHSIASGGQMALGLPNSFYTVDTRVFVIYRKELIAVNLENPDDFHIRPPEWKDEQWDSFIEGRRSTGVDYIEDERKVRVLWQTVGTTSGLMLENKKHWYQKNGRMPGVPFWPAMIDGDISGPGEKMLDKVVMAASADTEFLDEVRKGSGSIWILREGYISNIGAFQTEVSKNNGALFVKADFPGSMDQVASHIQRKPNPSTLEYGDKVRAELDNETRINSAMQGETQQNQAAIAKSMELAQGLISQSEYVENFNLFFESFQDLKASLIPFKYQLADVVEIIDENTGKPVSVDINQPEFDLTGEITGTLNDLSAIEFKFKITTVDDSPSAKEAERQQAMIFLNAVPGPLAQIDPSGELLAYFMSAMPNRILQQVGKKLLTRSQERAQAQQQQEQTAQMMESNERLMKLKNEAEKIKASKASLSITGEQIMLYPELTRLLQDVGYFEPVQQQLPPDVNQGGMVPQPPNAELTAEAPMM
jgi:hypothetical protein